MQSPASSLPAFLHTLQEATRLHQQAHGCSAHVFDDGPGLWQLLAQHQPQRILELGTGLGYTACLMACASPRAQVDTLAQGVRSPTQELWLANCAHSPHHQARELVLDAAALFIGTLASSGPDPLASSLLRNPA